jgi:hypothetical protein
VTPAVVGLLKNSVTDMDFTGETLTIQLRHKLDVDEWEDGCISSYAIDFSKAGTGCRFHLEMSTSANHALAATAATLEADSFCPGWSDEDEGEYLLQSSTLALCSNAEVADTMAQSACIPNVTLGFTGMLFLVRSGDGKPISVDLSALTLHGDVQSAGDAELPCPDICAGKECGQTSCGGSCGECEPWALCKDGYCAPIVCGDGLCEPGEQGCACPMDCPGGCTGCCLNRIVLSGDHT